MTNLHTHTAFSDGADTVEETVKAAITKGFTAIGISDHSVAPQNLYPGVEIGTFSAYLAEIRAVAKKYKGQIEVYAGIENEYCEPLPTDGLDYVIGSVHYLSFNGPSGGKIYNCVDSTLEEQKAIVTEIFGGDYYKLVKHYYEAIADMAITQKPDIIGHLDIITKFNQSGKLFDEFSMEYMNYVRVALDAIAQAGCVIEVNTGGMARGYATQPYPSWHILKEILKMKLPVTLTSDSHKAEDLDFAFAETAKRLHNMGVVEISCLK
jgi:histidinol-phosphatase (PHP family)